MIQRESIGFKLKHREGFRVFANVPETPFFIDQQAISEGVIFLMGETADFFEGDNKNSFVASYLLSPPRFWGFDVSPPKNSTYRHNRPEILIISEN